MTLARYSSSQALENGKLANAKYPAGAENDRLRPVAMPSLSPSFQLIPGEKIFTMGSCFARNIERALEQLGYDIPARAWSGSGRPDPKAPAEYLNKYTLPSMLNELQWGLGVKEFPGESALLQVGDDKWIDPHATPGMRPDTLDIVLNRRNKIHEIVQKARECRVVILTLGLSEAWYDKEAGLYLNALPSRTYLKNNPDGYEAHVLDYEQSMQSLEGIRDLLTQFLPQDFRIVISVSPVPLASTFTEFDVLQANAYSKSVLRAVAESFHRRHDNVDYMPSYEAVTLSHPRVSWDDDNRHVTSAIVGLNVARMVSFYAPGTSSADSEMYHRLADCLSLAGDFSGIAEARQKAIDVLADDIKIFENKVEEAYNASDFRTVVDLVQSTKAPSRVALLYHVVSYSRLAPQEQAISMFESLVDGYPGWALPSFRYGQYLWREGLREAARPHFNNAVVHQPALAARSPFHTAPEEPVPA